MSKFDEILEELDGLSDEALSHLMTQQLAATPWQVDPASSLSPTAERVVDEDGFTLSSGFSTEDSTYKGFDMIQKVSWKAFQESPFVFTTTLDNTGRLTGYGFSQHSRYDRCNTVMEEIWEDPRNGLVLNFSKYVSRAFIQGELFLPITLHPDGFVEVDFLSPSTIKGFENGSGILMAEGKPLFPLMYRVESPKAGVKFIPSINLAYYPELWGQALSHRDVQADKIVGANTPGKAYKDLRQYKTYMLQWDQGFVTDRNVGRVRVTLDWLEHYTNIKKWELDHKKSSGAYLWTIEVEDRQAFRMWLALTDEEREKTGLLKKKVPGGTIMLPPGFKLSCHNPKLASITNQDNDILQMISAGLNVPEDVMTGSSTGQTYSGAKLSRGPLTDRTKDQVVELERWLIHGFWRGILWLHHKATGMPWEYKERRAYKFEGKKPKFKYVRTKAHKTIEINFPTSEMGDSEGTARALLGVKHGAVTEQLGVSHKAVAARLGIQNYHQSRLDKATEDDIYPELLTAAEIESSQAKAEEPGLLDDSTIDNEE